MAFPWALLSLCARARGWGPLAPFGKAGPGTAFVHPLYALGCC